MKDEVIKARRNWVDPARQDRTGSASPCRLAAIVLLHGRPEHSGFEAAAGRSLLDLPVSSGGLSMLGLWEHHLTPFASTGPGAPALRLVLSQDAVLPRTGGGTAASPAIERDPAELRGTGGLLRDLALDYPDDFYLLFVSGCTVLLEPFAPLVHELCATGADVAFFVHDDGSFPNITLIRVGCLRGIPAIGFIDFKEQALPSIAAANSVSIVRRRIAIAASARTGVDYLNALRRYHNRFNAPAAAEEDAFAESWRSVFSIIEPQAAVDGTASILDSVVLAGAAVGRNATVVRSIICPGAVVPAHSTVVEEIVRPRSSSRTRTPTASVT